MKTANSDKPQKPVPVIRTTADFISEKTNSFQPPADMQGNNDMSTMYVKTETNDDITYASYNCESSSVSCQIKNPSSDLSIKHDCHVKPSPVTFQSHHQ